MLRINESRERIYKQSLYYSFFLLFFSLQFCREKNQGNDTHKIQNICSGERGRQDEGEQRGGCTALVPDS